MDARVWRAFALLILLGRFASAAGIFGEVAVCARVSAPDSILPSPRDSCSVAESPSHGFEAIGVVECQDELRGTVPRNEQANLSGFGELRLGSIEPAADFVLFAGQASGTSGSVTRSAMELFPDDQLEWGMSLSKMLPLSVRTSVCVRCSREFSLEGVESEPQSESLG